jgi:heterodisulfide reductase subunit C
MPTDVIKAIRNVAVAEGYMLVPHQKTALKVLEAGHAVPLDKESWENLREKVGIERVPPNASRFPEAIEEIKKIAKKTGFDKLVAEKEEKKED